VKTVNDSGFCLHFDCFSGMAGDMFLGACLDLGLPEAVLRDAVARVGLPDVDLEVRRASRGGIAGVRFRVLQHGAPVEGPDPDEGPILAEAASVAPHAHGPARHVAQIRDLIARSALSAPVRERAIGLFSRLGEAEARVHGTAIEHVHFHEVGAVDAIVDLVGAAAALEFLAPSRVTCGAVNVGSGTARTAHGELPVPAPATADLLRGVPIYARGEGELLTPTGAVLLAEFVDEFRELPPISIEQIGYGLGKRETAGRANAVRLLRGRAPTSAGDDVVVVECEIDDLPGEGFGFLIERLLGAGALDVYFTAVQMKKNRPGVLVTMLCRQEDLERLAGTLLAESGSLGCRTTLASRFEAQRESGTVTTVFGAVAVKRAVFRGRPLASTPEYEDCRRLALEHGVTWREVYRAALAALGATGA
jgi:uncharacterized protein (TIGR00299 family) protein